MVSCPRILSKTVTYVSGENTYYLDSEIFKIIFWIVIVIVVAVTAIVAIVCVFHFLNTLIREKEKTKRVDIVCKNPSSDVGDKLKSLLENETEKETKKEIKKCIKEKKKKKGEKIVDFIEILKKRGNKN